MKLSLIEKELKFLIKRILIRRKALQDVAYSKDDAKNTVVGAKQNGCCSQYF